MSLTPGTKLGPYEVVAPLGAGGMGEVYRAHDTRLGRDVAIKVLPSHLSANPEVRARFEREAKAVAALNHPNICVLHDVGREGDTDYLVMELIEGETLSQRLTRGALPPAEVLRLGAQIADALDRAHRAGVIHRDLKPGNVMLAKSGAKLMDFGLARATASAGPVAAAWPLTQHPTVASPLTAAGDRRTFSTCRPAARTRSDARRPRALGACYRWRQARVRGCDASLSDHEGRAPESLAGRWHRDISTARAPVPRQGRRQRLQGARDVAQLGGSPAPQSSMTASAGAPSQPRAHAVGVRCCSWPRRVRRVQICGRARSDADRGRLPPPQSSSPPASPVAAVAFRRTARRSCSARRRVLGARLASGARALPGPMAQALFARQPLVGFFTDASCARGSRAARDRARRRGRRARRGKER
jgi:hypothetical protein